MRKRLSVILTMLVILSIAAISSAAVIYAAGGATTTPTGTPLTQENISNYKQEKNSTYSENGVYLPAGSYYLAEDIYLVGDDADTNSAWPLIFEGDVTLDLNGHVLDLKERNISIYSNGNLTLTDSSPEAKHNFRVEDSGLWVLDETQGTETVTGGVITGGTGADSSGAAGILGGGVSVSSGSLTMEGGSIVGCTANNGGGVSVFYGSFTMTGGRIAGCTAVKSGNAYGNGGGVYVGDSATFNMNDGSSIVGCTADSGGGVLVDANSSFTMNGGAIRDCKADIGGGVYVGNLATFNMNDGSIVGCTANIGGGVYMGGLVTFNMTGGNIESCTADSGGGVYMGGGAQFEMKSGGEGKNPTIKNCIAVRAGGVYMDGLSTFNMNDGSIESCTADNGGGVYVGDGAQFEMKSGGEGKNPTIKNCIAVRAGGGVFVDGSATFTMNDGSIEDCKASGAANAVHADGNFTDNRTSKIDKSLVSGINGGHTGTADDPYLIGSVEGLKDFRNRVNRGNTGLCATLLCDIVLNDGTFDADGTYTGANGSTSAEQWTPIGDSSNPYVGTFDGGGKTIKGVYVTGKREYAGLFGYARFATIRNVTVDGYVSASSDSGYPNVGGIAGCARSTSITNCTNLCTVKIDCSAICKGCGVGGIAGIMMNSTDSSYSVTNCRNGGKVILKASCDNLLVGGIVGASGINVSVSGCYNTGAIAIEVTSNSEDLKSFFNVGGVVGDHFYNTVSNCYNTGSITVTGQFAVTDTGNVSFGGIVGSSDYLSNNDAVSNCYNVGKVTYTGNCDNVFVGSIAGRIYETTVTDCYYLTGTAENAVGENKDGTVTNVDARSKTAFTDGTVLNLLKQNDTTGAWGECGYLAAAGMTLPLLSWQTADMHTCTPENPSQWESDESGHWQVCSCGLFVNQAAHSGTDDGDCTTAVECGCGYVITGAEATHTWTNWASCGNGKHERHCKNSGCEACETDNCHGGTATCTEKASCETCGEKYGSIDPDNHTGSKEWTIKNETEHGQKYSCCDKTTVAKEAHEWKNGECTECGYTCTHRGGTATCTDKATCSTCGEEYGSINPDNHTGSKEWTIKNETEHEQKWSCCDKVTVAKEAHEWKNGECTECGYACTHRGGTATCTEKATCSTCGEEYGSIDPDNHTGSKEWTIKNETEHEQKWSCCDKTTVAKEAHEWEHGTCIECGYVCTHTGGTATCTEKATCETCGEKYGNINPDNHTGSKEWTIKNETEHEQKWSCCDKVTVAKEAHEWEHGVCSECGYACTHRGGTATCTDKATCSTCGEKYGNINPDNHTGSKEWTIKNETEHGQKYSCCDKTTVAKEAHEWKNGECTECGYTCTHRGGTATCTEKASCETCGEKYGNINPDNHTGSKEWTIKNETEHEQKWSCCDKVTVAKEAHEWEHGVCSECGYACTHRGGTATCTDKATCSTCGEKYGNINPDNHTGSKEWTIKNETEHEQKWSCCDKVTVAKEAHEWEHGTCIECGYVCTHTGGTATCTEKASCETCGEKYGSIDPDNHTGSKEWTIKNETEHEQKWSCCDKVTVAKEAHEWEHGTCTECGYTCTHRGGTATCTEKAMCETCGEKYGDLLPHTYKEEWSSDASGHWHECSACHARKDKTAHNPTQIKGIETTCEKSGNITYYECECGKLFYNAAATREITNPEKVVIPATGHTRGDEWKTSEIYHWHECTTCHERMDTAFHRASNTETDVHICAVCGYTMNSDHEHSFIEKNTDAKYLKSKASCTSAALYYYSCACGEKGEETFEYGEKLAHSFRTVWSKNADSHWHECSLCGEKNNESAHSFEWKTDKAATATEAGKKHEECTVCGFRKDTVRIEPIGESTSTTAPAETTTGGTSETPEKSSNTLIWTISSVVIVVIAGSAVYLVIKKKKSA